MRKAFERLAVPALLLGMAAQLAYGIAADGLTNDEVLYVPAGDRHLNAGDFRINPTQPPIAKVAAALGLVGTTVRLPEPRPAEDELAWAYRFVHEANDAGLLVRRARIPVAVLAVVLAAAVWGWTRQAAGPGAALLALALAAFHPSLLAHGHLATTDVPATTAMLLASWAFWAWSRDPTALRAALSGLLLGLAVATRLTAWLLLPVYVVLALRAARRSRWRAVASLAFALAFLPLTVIWASYGFERAPWPGASVLEPSVPAGWSGRLVGAVGATGLLPEAYLEGIRYQVQHNLDGHPAYLLGEWSRTGWPHYFLVAFLVKNTPGFLLAIVASAAVAVRRPRSAFGALPVAHWLLPAGVLFVAVSLGHIQIGERYILPAYPYAILFSASLLGLSPATRARRAATIAVVALHVWPALAAAPGGHLAYFNVLAGGRAHGHRVLLDSNLDWGQDLPRLAAWMRRTRVATVQLAYHGADDPERYGIRREDLPGAHLHPALPAAAPLTGTVAVSPNLLYGLLPRFRRTYEELRARPPDARAGVFFVYFLPARASEGITPALGPTPPR